MILLKLAFKSLQNRMLATLLTILSIALSVALFLGVEKARKAAQDGFTESISQTDLIVGARSGPVQLILYTIFNMGNATHNISYSTYQDIKSNPAIEWTIPYSLGDGHRGFRVVATNNDFFKFYRFRGSQQIQFASGSEFNNLWNVVIGSEVAKKLNYKLDDKVIVAHGVTRTDGILQHDDKPFHVSGILKPTGTPIDRAVYISLAAMEAIHMDWKDGAAPQKGKETPVDKINESDIKIETITSFFVRTKSRIDTLRLQREINNYKQEPLLAIIPGVTLSELWQSLSYVEQVLKLISFMVIAVAMVTMLIALMTILNERRREMAILRAIGASYSKIFILLVFESAWLAGVGILCGIVLNQGLIFVLKPWLSNEFGLLIQGPVLTMNEFMYLVAIKISAIAVGCIPALKAIRSSLKDGLIVKT